MSRNEGLGRIWSLSHLFFAASFSFIFLLLLQDFPLYSEMDIWFGIFSLHFDTEKIEINYGAAKYMEKRVLL